MASHPIFFGPLLYLRTVPALDRLNATQLGALAQHAEEEFFPQGSFLLPPGRPVEAFYVIVEGKVSVRTAGGGVQEAGPGESVGFLHLLARSEQDLQARALWDTVALRMDWDAHLDVCERHFPIVQEHLRFLALRALQEASLPRGEGPGHPAGAAHGEVDTAPLTLVRRLQALHRSRSFVSSNMDALAELARHLVEVRLEGGEELYRAGDPAQSFFLVASGRMGSLAANGVPAAEYGPGDDLGKAEALAGVPRRSTARSLGHAVLLRVDLDPLLDILEDHFTMSVDFMAALARESGAGSLSGTLSAPESLS